MKIPGALIFSILLTTNHVCHAQPSKFEASIGGQTLEIIKKTQGIYENPRLLSFVNDVGHTRAGISRFWQNNPSNK